LLGNASASPSVRFLCGSTPLASLEAISPGGSQALWLRAADSPFGTIPTRLHQLSLRSYWSRPPVIRRAETRLRFVARARGLVHVTERSRRPRHDHDNARTTAARDTSSVISSTAAGTSSSRIVIGRASPYRALGIMQTCQITEPLRDSIDGDSRSSTSLRRSRTSSNDLYDRQSAPRP